MSKLKPPADFDENPEWTDEDFARAKPAGEEQPAHVAGALVRKRGRPPGSTSSTKRQIALRVDADVADSFRDSGPGWQTRMNKALRTRVDVAYSPTVKMWVVSVNRPMEGVAGRVHDIIGAFPDLDIARSEAEQAKSREPGNAHVVVWPTT